MLKFVCDRCERVIRAWEKSRRVEISTLMDDPHTAVSIDKILRTEIVVDLCEECYEKVWNWNK